MQPFRNLVYLTVQSTDSTVQVFSRVRLVREEGLAAEPFRESGFLDKGSKQ